MSQVRYIISDASKQIDVEPHVLRYWEEELGIKVPRNEMGHRYYREQDIELFKGIKMLKEQGFQLRAIKMVLSDIPKIGQLDKKSIIMLKNELNAQVLSMDHTASEQQVKAVEGNVVELERKKAIVDKPSSQICTTQTDTVVKHDENKLAQFKVIMSNIVMDALRENNREFSKAMSSAVSENVLKEMDYMMRMKEEREEERFKQLDDSIRSRQKARKEVSATGEGKKKRRRGLFRKKA